MRPQLSRGASVLGIALSIGMLGACADDATALSGSAEEVGGDAGRANGAAGGAGSGGSAGGSAVGAANGGGGGGSAGRAGTGRGAGSSAGGASSGGVAGGSAGKTASGGRANGIGGRTNTGGNGSSGTSAKGGAGGGQTGAGRANSGGAASGTGGGHGGAEDSVDAAAMVSAMGIGTNIGNTLENTTSWETGWGQPLITQAYLNGLASRGIKTVRVPVAWDTYAVNGIIDSTKMSRVKQVVGWIESAGLYSIVNIHWDGGWIFNESNTNKFKLTDDVKTKFASYWSQIATAFSAVGHKLILEGLNEEAKFYVDGDSSKAPDYAALNQLNQLFVTTVRAQGGYNTSRALLIAGFNTDIDLTCVDAFTVPNDPAGAGKLFLSIHYYTPYTFCGLDSVESWGSPQTKWGTEAEKATLQSLFTKLAAFSTQKKIPVILGEFGVTLGEKYPRDPASRILWMETVMKASISHSIAPILWDTGSDIKRTDGSFSTEFQTVMDHLK